MGKINVLGEFKLVAPDRLVAIDYAPEWAILGFVDLVISYKVNKIKAAAMQIDWRVCISLKTGAIRFFAPLKLIGGNKYSNGGLPSNGKCALNQKALTEEGKAHEVACIQALTEAWTAKGLPMQVDLKVWATNKLDIRSMKPTQQAPTAPPPVTPVTPVQKQNLTPALVRTKAAGGTTPTVKAATQVASSSFVDQDLIPDIDLDPEGEDFDEPF